MADPELVAILVCPETRTRLHLADEALIARLNCEAAEGLLKNRVGQAIEGPIEGGLIREDGRFLYPIVDGIPMMLIDESIPLEAPQDNHG